MTRKITIRSVLNGWHIIVGCQQVVFTDKQTMLSTLSEYYDKPDEVEKRFIGNAVNKTQHTETECVVCAPECYGQATPVGLNR